MCTAMPSDRFRSPSFVAVGGGLLAYALGYVFTYALSIATVRESSLARIAEAFGDGGEAWKMVGWVFYNAHGATTTLDVTVPVFGGTSAVNLIARSDALSPVLYLIPPALLVAAGLAAARTAGVGDLGGALRVGPTVALGYLPPAVLGAVLFTVTVGDSVGTPTLLTAVALAGVVYPVVFGALGAAVAAVLSPGETRREAAA